MSGSKCKRSSSVTGTVLFKVVYCKIKNAFIFYVRLFSMYYLCEKYYETIIVLFSQLYSSGTWANCGGLRNKLDLQHALRMELIGM